MTTLTPAMKRSVAAYMDRTGASMNEAINLAGKGLLKADGTRKHLGGPVPKRGKHTTVEVTAGEKAEFDHRFPDSGVTLGHDDAGWFVMTHRAQSRRFKTIGAIPQAVVKKTEATG